MGSVEEKKVIAGRYRLERPLAQGGMGSVWIARHLQLDVEVAVKLMAPSLADSAQARARFEREAKASAQLKSPNVVQVHDYGVEDDTPFIVMELLEGEDLGTRLRRERRLSIPATAAVLVPVCRALRRAHEHGLVHRDLKPGNLFLARSNDEDVPKILDFGIAKFQGPEAAGSATKTGTLLGSPHYMSPEQVRKSNSVDHRSDLWSMGVIAFRCLTGELPFPGDEVGDVLVAICADPIPSASRLVEGAGPELDRFFERALSRQVETRFQSAGDFGLALAQLCGDADQPALLLSTRTPGTFPEPAPRTRMPVILMGEPATKIERPQTGAPSEAALAETVESGGRPAPPSETARSGRSSAAFAEAATVQSGRSPAPDTTVPSGRSPAPDTTVPSGRSPAPDTTVPSGRSPAPDTTVPPEAKRTPLSSSPGAEAASPDASAGATLSSARPRLSADPSSKTLASSPEDAPLKPARPPPSVRVVGPSSALPPGKRALFGLAGVAAVAVGLFAARSRFLGGAHAVVPPPAGCASNQACVAENGGRPALCRKDDGACVAIESEDCRALAEPGDVGNDATVWFGAMLPLGPGANLGPAANAMELARRDFAHAPDRKRPLAIVLCDDTAPANNRRAAEHLRDLRVPALVGFSRSKEVLELAPSVFLPGGMLALSSNAASTLHDIPAGPGGTRLVLRISPSVDVVTQAVAALCAQVVEPEAQVKGEPVRVTLVRAGNTTGQGYADLFVSTLRFNGKSVAENGDRFREIVAEGKGDHAAEIAAQKPNVVIVAGTSPALIPAVEKLWPAGEKTRPSYVVDAPLVNAELLAAVQEHPDLRKRVHGISAARSSAVLAKFVLHYNEVFSPKVTAEDADSAPYDGFYLLAYATAALRDQPVTGAALARALPSLDQGDRIDVGQGGVYRALSDLAQGKSLDLDGTKTSLHFDMETGDAAVDLSVGCLAPGEHGDAPHPVDSGLVFRAHTHKLEGTPSCP